MLRWQSLANTDFHDQMANYVKPYVGMVPFDDIAVQKAWKNLETMFDVYENILKKQHYLINDTHITLADLMTFAPLTFGMRNVLGDEWRAHHPNITRWFIDILQSPIVKNSFKDFQFAAKEPARP